MSTRLAIVVSHPIQYYSPWFRHLAAQPDLDLKVFYLWDFGVTQKRDPNFGTSFAWDIPLLEGYESVFVPNVAKDPGTHHFNGLNNPGLITTLEEWNPDAILLIGYNYKSLLKLIFSPRLRAIPILFRGDSHELYPQSGWKPRLNRVLRSLIFRRFTAVLAVGKASVGYFRSSGVSGDRIHIVPHCVDNERFQLAAPTAEAEASAWKHELGIPEESPVVLFAGKLEEKKRPQDLLQAFLNLPKEKVFPKASPVLLFVGSGHLEEQLREMAGQHLGKDVFFAPFQNQSAMPKVYATGNILVLPSYGRDETWGLAINEAMNLAHPAIVSTHVGCGPDLIDPGVTGWIFKAKDVPALTHCLNEALADPERLKTMGQVARQKIGNYSYDVATRGVLKVLKKLIKD